MASAAVLSISARMGACQRLLEHLLEPRPVDGDHRRAHLLISTVRFVSIPGDVARRIEPRRCPRAAAIELAKPLKLQGFSAFEKKFLAE
jgi:hypothetical protein